MKISDYINSTRSKSIGFTWREFSEQQVRATWSMIAKQTVKHYEDINPKLTSQLIYYVMRSDKFNGNLNKGILLVGQTGTGKTIYLKILSLTIGWLHKFRFLIHSMRDIETMYGRQEEVPGINQVMFGMDDIGEEHDRVKVYGSDINVGIEVLSQRHSHMITDDSFTFGTSNLNRKMLMDKYGARIDSRISEMFNVIPVTGKDLRK